MNNKKTILIFSYWLIVGGGEKALVYFLNTIPKDKYDITIIFNRNNFAFIEYIPKYVKVITPPFKKGMEAPAGVKNLIKEKFKQKKYLTGLCLSVGLLVSRFFYCNFLLKEMLFEKQNIKYDYIINWSGFNRIGSIICNDLYKHKKNYTWIQINYNFKQTKLYEKYYDKYDFVFCVSKALTDKVKSVYKNIADKIVTLYNPVDTEHLLKLSYDDGFKDNYKGCRILSVGRLDYVKGIDIAIKACKILTDKGYDFKWYIVGEGKEREKLTTLIKENNLENIFILLGEKINPYPFFKECDIYVQCSRSEGFCLTLAEAKTFNKPIITTVFYGAYEQITNNETGIIVETTSQSVAEGLQQLLDNESLKEKLIDNLKQENQKPKIDYFAELEKYF